MIQTLFQVIFRPRGLEPSRFSQANVAALFISLSANPKTLLCTKKLAREIHGDSCRSVLMTSIVKALFQLPSYGSTAFIMGF